MLIQVFTCFHHCSESRGSGRSFIYALVVAANYHALGFSVGDFCDPHGSGTYFAQHLTQIIVLSYRTSTKVQKVDNLGWATTHFHLDIASQPGTGLCVGCCRG